MKVTFKDKIERVGNVKTFIFQPEQPMSWQPGQYLHYILPHENADDRGIERWFTISSAPFEQDIWITTRIFGEDGSSFKQALDALEPDQSIETGEPEGSFVIENTDDHYVLIAGGIGITPYRSILAQLHHDGQPINATLLYANRNEQEVPFKDELEAISREHDDFNITYFYGDNLIDEAAIKAAAADLDNPYFYISGPKPMVESFTPMLSQLGIDETHIKLDDFPGYETY